MQVFMVICEWKDYDHIQDCPVTNMDWKVFRKKREAVDFISATFKDQPYYAEGVRPDLARLMETFEPERISGNFRCLELPSWLIGGTSWSAAISEETID